MSKLAFQLIEKNKQTRASFLDLGNCGLTEVPMELAELVWLEGLSTSSRWWWDGKMSTIQNEGPANTIRRLAPGDLAVPSPANPFAPLQNLKWLWLEGDWDSTDSLTDLLPLAGLAALQTLEVSATKVYDLSPLAGLAALQTLNVSATEVYDLSPLAGLTELQSLDASTTDIYDLSPLAGLAALQKLNVSATEVYDLSPLAGLEALQTLNVSATEVYDLSPLAGLATLQTIDISHTYVTNLSPLAGLSALKTLHLSNTQVTDLSPLAGLSALKTLHLSNTQVADLSPLAGLSDLQILYLNNTQVVDLSPLAGLADLQMLDVTNTAVYDLTSVAGLTLMQKIVAFNNISRWLTDIKLLINPANVPPPEVIEQGLEAVYNYLSEQQTQGVDHLFEAKLLIVGEARAGKTSLLRRLYQPDKSLPKADETTKGIDIYRHPFNMEDGRVFYLNIWDFGGQEIYQSTHQFFLTKRSLYILLDDTLKDNRNVQDKEFKYWLEVIDQLSEHSPVLIFQNERDDRSKEIDLRGIKAYFDNVKDCYRGNLKYPNTADNLRKAVRFYAINLPHIGDALPAQWVTIRADLETVAQRHPYITQQAYFDLYAKHLEFDRVKALHLSRYFHDLGVFLHFQDDVLLQKTVILQNTWATEAVYKMLDDEPVKAKKGRFTLKDCQRVWRDSVYADMHAELLVLMQKFDMCYPLPDEAYATWLVPQLLSPSKPDALANWAKPGDLVLRYRYDFMPKGLVSRLMVRLHRFVLQPDLGWVTGVLFERDGTQALVEIPPQGGEIALRVRGPEPKELCTIISADLDALNGSFHGLKKKIQKLVSCNCTQCQNETDPNSYELQMLIRFRSDGIFIWKCSRSYSDVSVIDLLDGIQSKPLTLNMKRIFICYSKKDENHKNNLLEHLSSLRGKILTWNDQDLLPGEEWDAKIKYEIRQADIILYLVSSSSIATEYIQNIELPLIEVRCQKGECKLVPVIVRPCDWPSLDFAKYNALPDKGKAITTWDNVDEAWLRVVDGIKKLV